MLPLAAGRIERRAVSAAGHHAIFHLAVGIEFAGKQPADQEQQHDNAKGDVDLLSPNDNSLWPIERAARFGMRRHAPTLFGQRPPRPLITSNNNSVFAITAAALRSAARSAL